MKRLKRPSATTKGFTHASARNFEHLLANEPQESTHYLTTFQAASLLGVTTERLNRWVRLGLIEAKEIHGSYYIAPAVIEALLGGHTAPKLDFGKLSLFCWEYRKEKGEDISDCTQCLAYRVQPFYCFEVPRFFNHCPKLKLRCDSDCTHCSYFKYVQEQALS